MAREPFFISTATASSCLGARSCGHRCDPIRQLDANESAHAGRVGWRLDEQRKAVDKDVLTGDDVCTAVPLRDIAAGDKG